ncbi:MAG: hypothetical protein WED07_06505 [Candidatus Freyarchaeum deiterrae]
MSNVENRIENIKARAAELDEPIRDVLLDIIDLISGLYREPLSAEKPAILQFIKEKDLESHTECVIGMAYYLYKFEGINTFNLNDIKNLYNAIRRPLPTNLNDIIAKACEQDYFIESRTKADLKAWRILTKGIKFIEERKIEKSAEGE